MANSRLANPSATIAVLERHGLRTRKALGQHFLIDDNVVGRILQLAALAPGEPVLEIGPGIGTLTDALLSAGARVIAIEYDQRLLPALEEVAADRPLEVVLGDAVTLPLEELPTDAGEPRALVANLPYGVAATVVLRFLEQLPSLGRAVVMVQAEVADRMSASPGTKAYGAYTAKLALFAEVTARFAVPRGCFLPPPRVDSAVVRLERVDRGLSATELAITIRAIDAAFTQRRKTLRNSFAAGLRLPVSQAERILAAATIDASLRAENLTLDEYVALGKALSDAERAL